MTSLIKESSIRKAIEHLAEYGDTDIFPHSYELKFYKECADEVIKVICGMNLLSDYKPASALECIAPKSNKGFRVCHLLAPKDTLILTSAVLSIADKIESSRIEKDAMIAFSYRYDSKQKSLFTEDCRYKSWIKNQHKVLSSNTSITHVIKTDISDFYQRIYQHRLENELSEVCPASKINIRKLIINMISDIRAKQSFGIPVGTNAARILAELLLNETDQKILNEGYYFTRYVDDFRIFLTEKQNAYACLAFLSEHLLTTEGLSLGEHKTYILTKEDYLNELEELLGIENDEDDIERVEFLYHKLYEESDAEYDEDLENLRSMDLVSLLDKEIKKDKSDSGRVRVLLRAMRITQPEDVIDFLYNNLSLLIPYSKDLVFLLDDLSKKDREKLQIFTGKIIELLLAPPLSENLPLLRSWLLELFVRDILSINTSQLSSLKNLNHTLDNRQMMLIRSKLKDKSYFRTSKTKFDEFNEWEKTMLIYGAKCLPENEFEKWISTIKKKSSSFFMVKEYCNWVIKVRKDEEDEAEQKISMFSDLTEEES